MRRVVATLLLVLATCVAVAAPVLAQDRERTPTELWEEYPLEDTAPAPELPGGEQAPAPADRGAEAGPGAGANQSGGEEDDGSATLLLAGLGALALAVAGGVLWLLPARRRRAAKGEADAAQADASGGAKSPPEGPRDTRRRKSAPGSRPDPAPTPPVVAPGAVSREGAAREAAPPRPAAVPAANGRGEPVPVRPVPAAKASPPGPPAGTPERDPADGGPSVRPTAGSTDVRTDIPATGDPTDVPATGDATGVPATGDATGVPATGDPTDVPDDGSPKRVPDSKRFSRPAPPERPPGRRASEAGRAAPPHRPGGPRPRLSDGGSPPVPPAAPPPKSPDPLYASPPSAQTGKNKPSRAKAERPQPTSERAGGRESGSEIPAGRRAVGYTIVPEGDESNSPRLREEARHIQVACKQRGLVLSKLVRDMEAQSGSDLKRPGLTYALERLGAGEFGVLVVTRLDRLTRSAANLGALIRLIDERNARLIVIDIELDTRTHEGRLAADALVKVGGLERKKLELRTRKGLEAAREQRRSSGRPAVADRPSLKRRIADMRAGGMTLQGIADTLNEEGVPTVRGGAEWRPSSVQAAAGYKRPSRRNRPTGGSANKPPGS